jgi:hypothetical protein
VGAIVIASVPAVFFIIFSRIYIAHSLPADAVEYVIPLMNGLAMDDGEFGFKSSEKMLSYFA